MTRKRLLKILATLVLLGGLAAAAILVAHAANSPSEGVIKAAPPMPASRQSSGSPVTVRGKTASFQYPGVMRQTKADALTSGDVEKFAFVNPDMPPWNLSIQVRKLPSGQLADDGSYNFRHVHPEQYTEQKLTANGAPASIMSDRTAGFGKVAFLVHGGLAAEIALTSTDTADTAQLQAALMTVTQTWHWL
jgi:hypothetical protein